VPERSRIARVVVLGLFAWGGPAACTAGPRSVDSPTQPRDRGPEVEQDAEAEVDAGAVDRLFVDPHAWRPVPAKRDPHRQAAGFSIECDETAYFTELIGPDAGSVFEVDTEICNYVTLEQASLAAIPKGASLELTLWHYSLRSLESAVAVAEVRVGGQQVWHQELAIPSEAQSYESVWRPAREVPAGTPVQLHIRNHGTNTWRLGSWWVRARQRAD